MTRNGAIAGMACGGITSALWPLLRANFSAPIFGLYEIVPGFIVALITIYVVSVYDRKYSKRWEIWKYLLDDYKIKINVVESFHVVICVGAFFIWKMRKKIEK